MTAARSLPFTESTPVDRNSDLDVVAKLGEIRNHHVGSGIDELPASIAGPVDADHKSVASGTGRGHARRSVFTNGRVLGSDAELSRRFEKSVRRRLACESRGRGLDASDAAVDHGGEATGLENAVETPAG